MVERDDSGQAPLSRREFAKAALVIGGPAALSACLDRELASGETTDPSPTGEEQSGDQSTPGVKHHPRGPTDRSVLPERQHAWNDYLVTDPAGNTILPQHQLLLFTSYTGSGQPTETDRRTVESAFETIDSAFQRGTGANPSANFNRGLLYLVGYSPQYFDRFDADLPDDVDLRAPSSVLEAVGEDPENADEYDAVVVMGADDASVLLATEQALFGEADTINGLSVEETLEGVFELSERRTGFVGSGLPHDRIDDDRISESARDSRTTSRPKTR